MRIMQPFHKPTGVATYRIVKRLPKEQLPSPTSYTPPT